MITLPPDAAKEGFAISRGDVEVRVYPCRKTYTISYYERGERKKKSYVSFTEVVAEAEFILNTLYQAELDASSVTRREVAYFRAQEGKLGGIPLDRVVDEYVERNALHPHSKKLTVTDAVAQFMESRKSRNVSQRHISGLTHELGKFCGAFGQQELRLITPADIKGFLEKGWTNHRTRNNIRCGIVTLFRWARDTKDWLPQTPRTVPEKVEKYTQDFVEPEIYSPEELETYLTRTPSKILPFICVTAFTGIRAAETKRLRWESINWADKLIPLSNKITKTKIRRVVPILPVLEAWLEKLKQPEGPLVLRRDPYRIFREELKLPWRDNGWRHSFATYHLALHNDPKLTSWICGHSENVLLTTYKSIQLPDGRFVTRDLAERWFNTYPK